MGKIMLKIFAKIRLGNEKQGEEKLEVFA